jgi:4-alpha-glucanotransferase
MKKSGQRSSIENKTKRSAGILLHITSLPGPAFIGDIGPSAKRFADFLSRSGQTVWQMLPLQPATTGNGYSPYSPSSAMATNPMLISVDMLVEKKLLSLSDIQDGETNDSRVNYNEAEHYKERLLDKAWKKWNLLQDDANKQAFKKFCAEENEWLHDYALFVVLKSKFQQRPWYEWPDVYRDRNKEAIRAFAAENTDAINKTKWIQMVFREQWNELKSYCTSKKIRLVGDIPMYVAHDSADVWSNRDIFTLDENGLMTKVAGVPPDLFNDNGQLWGMPLFRWNVIKNSGYKWWIDRVKNNFAYFDVVRLDHFRGFSSYWSVAANARTAKGGQWVVGPGKELFDAIEHSLGKLEFIAEDLGEIDHAVYELRDQLQLPGMNVLQFAFSDDMPYSPYLPHNHKFNSVVYTGTHDNNTSVGWYNQLSPIERENVREYLSIDIDEKNISDHLSRIAYGSVAALAVLPMQDVLSLDESARMNFPASVEGNWTWRLEDSLLTASVVNKLKRWVYLFDR